MGLLSAIIVVRSRSVVGKKVKARGFQDATLHHLNGAGLAALVYVVSIPMLMEEASSLTSIMRMCIAPDFARRTVLLCDNGHVESVSAG